MNKIIHKKMYKNIIPSLVSFNTNVINIKGFYLSQNLNFYPNTDKKSKFHYQIDMEENIEIPSNYDFRAGYYLKKGRLWFYDRPFKISGLKFRYDPDAKKFTFNKLYSYIPFEIGSIFPIGLHLADLINFDLFLTGRTLIRGNAFIYHHKTYLCVAPGMNGKTSLINLILKKGGKYIGEDQVVLEHDKIMVYPLAPHTFNFGRHANSLLQSHITQNNTVTRPLKVDKIFIYENTQSDQLNLTKKTLFDYYFFNALKFCRNRFIWSYILGEGFSKTITKQIEMLKQIDINYEFIRINNFNFEPLLKKIE